MNTFPTISVAPKFEGFVDEYSDGAVDVADSKSGYPFVNVEFNIDPRHFSFILRNVPQIDKLAVEVFYQANKDVSFDWLNEQNDVTYEVVFASKPSCELDGANNKWKIELSLIQTGV